MEDDCYRTTVSSRRRFRIARLSVKWAFRNTRRLSRVASERPLLFEYGSYLCKTIPLTPRVVHGLRPWSGACSINPKRPLHIIRVTRWNPSLGGASSTRFVFITILAPTTVSRRAGRANKSHRYTEARVRCNCPPGGWFTKALVRDRPGGGSRSANDAFTFIYGARQN